MENTYEELFQKLSRLQWLLQRSHLQNHAEHGPLGDPTRGQGRVLAMLKLQPEISTRDLSYLLGIRQQSLNELLNKLEKAEYVTREPAPEDRRVMMVQLTDKGRNEEQKKPESTNIFDCLSEQEQVTFSDCLDRLITALEAQLGTDHGCGPGFGEGRHHGHGPHGPGHHGAGPHGPGHHGAGPHGPRHHEPGHHCAGHGQPGHHGCGEGETERPEPPHGEEPGAEQQ